MNDNQGGIVRPALVLFDGQNVFDHGPYESGGWEIHRAIDGLDARHSIAPRVFALPARQSRAGRLRA